MRFCLRHGCVGLRLRNCCAMGPEWLMDNTHNADKAASGWYIALREDSDDPELRSAFEAWLAQDPQHRQSWQDINATARIMKSVPAMQRRKRQRGVRYGGYVAAMGMAAAACLATVLLVPDLMLRLRADYYAPPGMTRDIRLADGSRIVLAPRTALAVHVTPRARQIELLRGEAYFIVRHDETRPFLVNAGPVTTTDIGTEFDARTDGSKTEVVVKEGEVHVSARSGLPFEKDLRAGNWAEISRARAATGNQSPDTIALWRTGTLVAQDNTIAEMVAALQPWMHARIMVMHGSLMEKRVTGSYDLHHPEEALALIVRPYGGEIASFSPWLAVVTGH